MRNALMVMKTSPYSTESQSRQVLGCAVASGTLTICAGSSTVVACKPFEGDIVKKRLHAFVRVMIITLVGEQRHSRQVIVKRKSWKGGSMEAVSAVSGPWVIPHFITSGFTGPNVRNVAA